MPQKPRLRTFALAILLATVATGATAEEADYRYSTDWTTPNTQAWLRHLAKFIGKPEVHGLEIGCFEGRSSIWFLERIATHPTSGVTCIDVFTDAIEARFDHNLAASGLSGRMTKRKGYSQDVLRTLEYGSFDFAYVDGCHLASCVLTDAVLIWDLLKPGGVLIFDDYLWNLDAPPSQRPKIAIDAFTAIFRDRIRVRSTTHQVILEKLESERTEEALVGAPIVHSEAWEERYERQRKQQTDPE